MYSPLHERGPWTDLCLPPGELSKDLQNELAGNLLKKCGYGCVEENACLRKLIERLNLPSDFPHDIGLFPGYSPEDVDGFSNHKEEMWPLEGLWRC